jgi:hypothetical protein
VLLPDRTGFMGDYLLRQGAVLARDYARTFPQSLALDRWVQGCLVPGLGANALAHTLVGARWLGLIACIATLVVSVFAVRQLGSAARYPNALILILGCSGYLCVFTGYTRDTIELVPLTLLLVTGLFDRIDRPERMSPAPELVLLVMLSLHRSALCLTPAYAFATSNMVMRRDTNARVPVRWLASVGLLLLGVALLAPIYVRTILEFDLPRHAGWLRSSGGPRSPIMDPRYCWDLLNAVLLLAPTAPLAAIALGSSSKRDQRALTFLTLFGWAPVALFMRVQQGPFRDYDVFACLAAVLSLLAVRALADLHPLSDRAQRVAMFLATASTLQASFGILLVSSNALATEARVRDGLRLSAPEERLQKAQMSEYLGSNAQSRLEWEQASLWFRDAAELVPSPLRLLRAGVASARTEDWRTAQRFFGKLVISDSSSVLGWCGYASSSLMLHDSTNTRLADSVLASLCRTKNRRLLALQFLNGAPAVDRSGLVRQRLRALEPTPLHDSR